MSTEYHRGAVGGTEYEDDARPAPAPPAGPADPSVPRAIGRFRVEGLLGRGGMGVVYKARDPNMGDREVALKVVSRARFDEFGLSQLRGETEKMAKLRHPNILTVYESGVDPETRETFIVMEYAPGGSLAQRLNKEPQRPHLAAELTATLADAVQAVHALELIHRDLKPQNVLLTENGGLRPGLLRITDFGLATSVADRDGKPVARPEVAGTPEYMAPEQTYPGGPLTGAVDIYALGVILYELLTGRHPFPRAVADTNSKGAKGSSGTPRQAGRGSRGATLDEQFQRIRVTQPVPPRDLVPRLDRDLETICLTCLHKDPDKRYPAAGELAADLRRFLNRESIRARPAPWWERTRRWVNKYPWPAALVATVAAGVVAGVGLVVWKNRDFRRQIAELENTHKALELVNAAQHEESLAALDGIRDSVLYGELRQVGGLEPLTKSLRRYYDEARSRVGKDSDPLPDAAPEVVKKAADRSARLGDLFDKTGSPDKAEQEYARAARLYGRQGAVAEQAAACLDWGRVLARDNNFPLAGAKFDEADRLLTGLRAAAPDDPQLALELAEVWHQRGVLCGMKVEWKQAVDAYERADAIRKKLYKDLPEGADGRHRPYHLWVQRDYGRTFGYRGDIQLELGRRPEADSDYWQSHAVREKIAKAGDGNRAAGGPAAEESDADKEAARTGDGKAAAAEACRHAYRHDPVEATFQYARAWINFVNFHGRNRSPQTADYFATRGLALLEEVVKDRPNNVEYKFDLGSDYNLLSDLALRSGDPGRAECRAKQAADVFEPLHKRDKDNPNYKQELGRAYALKAAALVAEDKNPAGKDSARRAEASQLVLRAFPLLDDLARSKAPCPDARFYRALALALAADLKVSPSQADGASALDALDEAVKRGYRGRHPDDVRDDKVFRKVVTESEKERFEALLRRMAETPADGGP